jgi:hypothetical protein
MMRSWEAYHSTLINGKRQVVIVEPRQLSHNEKVDGSKLEARRRPRSLSTKQKAGGIAYHNVGADVDR